MKVEVKEKIKKIMPFIFCTAAAIAGCIFGYNEFVKPAIKSKDEEDAYNSDCSEVEKS